MAVTTVPESVASERDALAQELFETRRTLVQLAIERQALSDRLATLEPQVRTEAAALVGAAYAERDRAFEQRDAAIAARDSAGMAQREAEAALARVIGSTAWRLTAPVRFVLIRLLGRER